MKRIDPVNLPEVRCNAPVGEYRQPNSRMRTIDTVTVYETDKELKQQVIDLSHRVADLEINSENDRYNRSMIAFYMAVLMFISGGLGLTCINLSMQLRSVEYQLMSRGK